MRVMCACLLTVTLETINEQCEARLHRKGQTEKVLCYYLECAKTVDKHMDKLNNVRSEDLRTLLEEDL